MVNGQVTGTVKYHRALKGEGILERDIIVWLPPGYDSSSKKRYPVIYMQDGQNLFDPMTSAFGTYWQIDVFSKAICMSPAFSLPGDPVLGWNYVSTVKHETKRKKVYFFIDNGGIRLEQRLQLGIDEMLKALTNKGYRAGRDLIYVSDSNSKHNEEAWARRFPYALKLVAGRQ
jgi:predicted alpha/beta superfamily hydrolase